jgi:hypothetical protein
MVEIMTAPEAQQAREQLMQLGLGQEELEALRHQGFVAPEFRVRAGRRWGPCYKLRWRQHGRQRVLYLGIDASAVNEIRAALERWQQTARLQKEVERLFRQTRKALQSLKDALSPQISAAGKRWHGYQSRRPRKPSPEA